MTQPKHLDLDCPLTKARLGKHVIKLEQLQRLGIITVRDLLTYWPAKYEDRTHITSVHDAQEGEHQTFVGYIEGVAYTNYQETDKWHKVHNTWLYDTHQQVGSYRDGLRLLWYGQNHPARALRRGYHLQVHGTVSIHPSDGHLRVVRAEFDVLDPADPRKPAVNAGAIVPIYSLTGGIRQEYLRHMIWMCLEKYHQQLARSHPGETEHTLSEILWTLHFPREGHHPALARAELATGEIVAMQMALSHLREERQNLITGVPIPIKRPRSDSLAEQPFTLTPSQRQAVEAIRTDISRRGAPMNRVLQGDAGSGKIMVALRTILDTAIANLQSVLLAPDELMAEQHMRTIANLLDADRKSLSRDGLNVRVSDLWRSFVVDLITSSTKGRQRQRIYREIKAGAVDLVISTLPALGDKIEFHQLGLTITTSQHCFDTGQRPAVVGDSHHLMLTDIPIPRILQQTMYRDLDFTTVEPDPHHTPVQAMLALDGDRTAAWEAVEDAVHNGRQAIVICPTVKPGGDTLGTSVSEMRAILSDRFPGMSIGVMHEQMSGRNQRDEMRGFQDGWTSLLITTSMIETGINVPNAAISIVEGADRFGMARLHQLRGFIGRGPHLASCYLVATPGQPLSERSVRRLETVAETSNGLELAEADLQIRRRDLLIDATQWDRSSLLKTGDSYVLSVLEDAHAVAEDIIARDPHLKLCEHLHLLLGRKRMLARLQQEDGD